MTCRNRNFFYSLLLALFSLLIMPLSLAAELKTQPLAINLDEVQWSEPGGGNGSPEGLQVSRLGVDPVTQGITYLAKFPAGTHFDLHWHTHDEFVSVQKGSVIIELGDETYTLNTGAYIVIPGRMNHSWDMSLGEVVILVRRAGPADRTYVEPH